jgi:hypothetical protein
MCFEDFKFSNTYTTTTTHIYKESMMIAQAQFFTSLGK